MQLVEPAQVDDEKNPGQVEKVEDPDEQVASTVGSSSQEEEEGLVAYVCRPPPPPHSMEEGSGQEGGGGGVRILDRLQGAGGGHPQVPGGEC